MRKEKNLEKKIINILQKIFFIIHAMQWLEKYILIQKKCLDNNVSYVLTYMYNIYLNLIIFY